MVLKVLFLIGSHHLIYHVPIIILPYTVVEAGPSELEPDDVLIGQKERDEHSLNNKIARQRDSAPVRNNRVVIEYIIHSIVFFGDRRDIPPFFHEETLFFIYILFFDHASITAGLDRASATSILIPYPST